MALNNQNIIGPYKECAARGCSKQGVNHLKILFVNMYGWFCDTCADDMKRHGLVKELQNNTDLGLRD